MQKNEVKVREDIVKELLSYDGNIQTFVDNIISTVKANPIDASVSDVCEWRINEDGIYETECNNMFILDNLRLADNNMKYCCYCGKATKEIEYNEQTA